MASRHYTVGLPVTIRVNDNGRVDYDIDTADAEIEMLDWDLSLLAEEMESFDSDTLEERFEADRVLVANDHNAHGGDTFIRISTEAWAYIRDLIQVDAYENTTQAVADELSWTFDA